MHDPFLDDRVALIFDALKPPFWQFFDVAGTVHGTKVLILCHVGKTITIYVHKTPIPTFLDLQAWWHRCIVINYYEKLSSHDVMRST